MAGTQSRTRRRFTRVAALGALALLIVAGLATAAGAADGDDDDSSARVVLTGRLDVADGETVSSAVIFDGPLVIDGTVDGPAVAFNGDIVVTATGVVSEQVVALNGRAIVMDGATVDGDVVSSKPPRVADGADVSGEVERVDFANAFNAFGVFLVIAWWIAVTLSLLILGVAWVVLFPRAVTRSMEHAHNDIGSSIGVGIMVAVVVPLVAAGMIATLVGVPLGAMVLLACFLLWGLGLVTASLFLGRLILRGNGVPVVAFLLGFAILRFVDLIPFFGGLVTVAATVYGVGALGISAWRAGRDTPTAVTDANPPAEPPATAAAAP